MSSELRPPVPPFTEETALKKVKAAQNLWNTKVPESVVKAYTENTLWRNREHFFRGRAAAQEFLTKKWQREHFYILRKELFAFQGNKIAVQWNDQADGNGQWYRSYGLEDWTFADSGLMESRHSSINDVKILDGERWFKGITPDQVDTVSIPTGHV